MRYSETEVSSPQLDQPPFAGEPRKLFICSTPRSGSYLLCRYMINAGLGVPHEYFNPIIMRQMAPRLGLGERADQLGWTPPSLRDRLPFRNPARQSETAFLKDYLAKLVEVRCQSGIFAAKLHFKHFVKVLDNPTGHRLLNGGVFIHLYRENLLGQAISVHFANLTGRWSIDDAITTKPADNPNFFDTAAIDREVRSLAEREMGWRVFFAQNGMRPISVSYERFCQDPYGLLDQIAAKVGIDPASLRRDYTESLRSETASDPKVPDRAEVMRRYVAAFRTIPNTSYNPTASGHQSRAAE
jgi:LPS sulfotransferase NodH